MIKQAFQFVIDCNGSTGIDGSKTASVKASCVEIKIVIMVDSDEDVLLSSLSYLSPPKFSGLFRLFWVSKGYGQPFKQMRKETCPGLYHRPETQNKGGGYLNFQYRNTLGCKWQGPLPLHAPGGVI